MPKYAFANPANWGQVYYTTIPNDPGVPAGYVLEGGVDGAPDRDEQFFVAGTCSGGYPRYPVTGNDMLTDLRTLDGTGATGV